MTGIPEDNNTHGLINFSFRCNSDLTIWNVQLLQTRLVAETGLTEYQSIN